jgi:hypothetical protein
MNQMTTFILIFSGLGILFYVMGIGGQNGTSNPMIALLLDPGSMNVSLFWTAIVAQTAALGAAFFIGYYTKNVELAAMTAILPLVISNLMNFGFVISAVFAFNKVITVLVFGPLMYLLTMTTVDYWRGRD